MKQKTIAIHQPNFLPWLGYFHKLIHSDVFILFDDVQFPRAKSFGNRVLIKTNNGTSWITVPVAGKSDLPAFDEIEISDKKWYRKALRTIQINYSKAPFFQDIFPELENILSSKHSKLYDLNKALILWITDLLNCKTELVSSRDLCGGEDLDTMDKIFFLLEKTKATHYISGTGSGSKRYLDTNEFDKRNIKLVWQKFDHPVYNQLYGEFEKNLSIIDMLFNCGPEESYKTLDNIKLYL